MPEQILDCTVPLQHAIPFDSHIDIIVRKLQKLLGLAVTLHIACAYLLRIYIV